MAAIPKFQCEIILLCAAADVYGAVWQMLTLNGRLEVGGSGCRLADQAPVSRGALQDKLIASESRDIREATKKFNLDRCCSDYSLNYQGSREIRPSQQATWCGANNALFTGPDYGDRPG